MPDLHSRICYKYRDAQPWCTGAKVQQKAVSYTHLTLPTSDLV